MERKASSLRFTRGRLAALLSAVVLVTIVVFSLTFYHLCLHAKRMEVLTQGDGPLWAFEQGQLDVLSQEADGATVLTVEQDGDVWRLQAVRCGEKGEVRRTARAVTRDRDPARQADRLVQKVRAPH